MSSTTPRPPVRPTLTSLDARVKILENDVLQLKLTDEKLTLKITELEKKVNDLSQPPPVNNADKPTREEASRFLQQSTFGPTSEDIDELVSLGYSQWFKNQLNIPVTSAIEYSDLKYSEAISQGKPISGHRVVADIAYRGQILQKDQLRQRMVYSLSQIFVVSMMDPSIAPQSMCGYIDVLNKNAFGNYKNLLKDITYSPAMAVYLTYLNNKKADPNTGVQPDQNYAREILQLFSIGLIQLNEDGTPKLQNNQQIETYTNEDIRGLSRVFTGLTWSNAKFYDMIHPEADYFGEKAKPYYEPLKVWENYHTNGEKTFLGKTIPANTSGIESISQALDIIFSHSNVAPFICKLLIQRFVTSNPSSEYVKRVVNAFNSGTYKLLDNSFVGTKERGDFTATLAAILFDSEARNMDKRKDPSFGKVREPLLKFAHWARNSNINNLTVLDINGKVGNYLVGESHIPYYLNQAQYRSPSVFNFYRPGYILPGSETSKNNLVAPEMQITNTTTLVNYNNFLLTVTDYTEKTGITFIANYQKYFDLAKDCKKLLNHFNLVLTFNTLSNENYNNILKALEAIPEFSETAYNRVCLCLTMIGLTPEYNVLR